MSKYSREQEVQDRLQQLTDNFSGYNLNYVYDELNEISDIVWDMIEAGEELTEEDA